MSGFGRAVPRAWKRGVPRSTARTRDDEADAELERARFIALAPVLGFCGSCGVNVDEANGKLHGSDCPYLPAERKEMAAMTNVDKRLSKHWKTTRPSKSNPDHLSHAHLHNGEASEKAGRDVYWTPVLKITNVSIGLVKSQDKPNGEELIFLHFEGQSRKLGLNTTNSKTMTSLSGSPVPMRWIGLSIQLYVDPQAKYPKGEKGPAIRIRPTLPKSGATSEPLPDTRAEDVERLEAARDERVGENSEQGSAPGQEG